MVSKAGGSTFPHLLPQALRASPFLLGPNGDRRTLHMGSWWCPDKDYFVVQTEWWLPEESQNDMLKRGFWGKIEDFGNMRDADWDVTWLGASANLWVPLLTVTRWDGTLWKTLCGDLCSAFLCLLCSHGGPQPGPPLDLLFMTNNYAMSPFLSQNYNYR